MPPIPENRPSQLVSEAIAEILTPHLGATMARSAVAAHRERLGLLGEQLSDADLEILFKKIGQGLVIFVGRERTDAILAQARGAARRVVAL